MKTKIFLIVLMVIFVLAVIGYVRATPGAGNQAASSKIKVTPIAFDFGKISYGEVAKHSFQVTNIGRQDLEIKRVSTSCACTTAKITQTKILPGQTTTLDVIYDTGAMSGSHARGEQERTIYIKSNDPINPQVEVKIEANVE